MTHAGDVDYIPSDPTSVEKNAYPLKEFDRHDSLGRLEVKVQPPVQVHYVRITFCFVFGVSLLLVVDSVCELFLQWGLQRFVYQAPASPEPSPDPMLGLGLGEDV